MFVDVAEIFVKGGNGGNGVISFRREKYVPMGGPDGGDGGKGGDVILEVDPGLRTLMDFRYKRKYVAQNGEHGKGKNMTGKNGEDLIVKVPPGTIIKDAETGEVLADLVAEGQRAIVAKGGRGGRGNARFASATMKAPRFAESGQPGEEHRLILELKLLADVGLLGFPNVGKSTILSVVTAARPKIADYPFTTLTPNLGVVDRGEDSFVIADIPGLIEGAHEGVGLGHEFLRHIERTKVLVHVLDVSGLSGRDPVEDFDKVNEELALYSQKLMEKKQIIAANKLDVTGADKVYERVKRELGLRGYEVYGISAATGMGINKLMDKVVEVLKEEIKTEHKEDAPIVNQVIEVVYKKKERPEYEIHRDEEGRYVIEGAFVDRVMSRVNTQDIDSIRYLQASLQRKGIMDELLNMGIKDGDIVKIKEYEFEYRA
ncbi:GTP-binding protein [Caldanaerobius fijiensis DSM 17918]|uniref:GTPase Obg n=1 Tax=Caldanaerobius fijiensis DSM 17918 TaxID=1121256 RepID=A0A1M4SS19_9THEO|nr:GTPase ObgE [Caldanaerobius fijiensis]SHE34978.1 GTP-binding protein [Caldanaerobius fijiensis DSM 17918]